MNAQAVRRGGNGRSRSRKSSARGKAAPAQRQASKLARWAFGLFATAVVAVAAIALDLPAKAGVAAGMAAGEAGFAVDGYQIVGLKRMDRRLVDEVVRAELSRVAEFSQASGKPAQLLVDVDAIRQALLGYG